MSQIMTPEEVDELWKLPRGKAQRLARKHAIPAHVFPDGTIRFDTEELQAHLKSPVHQKEMGKPLS